MNVTAGGRIKATFTYSNRASSVEQRITKPIEIRTNQNNATGNPNQVSHLTTRISPFSIPANRNMGDHNSVRVYSPMPTIQQCNQLVNRQPLTERDMHHRQQPPTLVEPYNQKYGITGTQNASYSNLKPIYTSPERPRQQLIYQPIQRSRRNPLEPEFKLRSAKGRPDTPPQVRAARMQALNSQPLPNFSNPNNCAWCKPDRIQFDNYQHPTHSWC